MMLKLHHKALITSPLKGHYEKDPEVNSILGYELEISTSKFLENPSSIVENFLSQLSTPSHSHSLSSGPDTLVVGDNILIKLQQELREAIILRKGEDRFPKLNSFLLELNNYESQISKDKLAEMESTMLLVNTMASRFHDLKTHEVSKNQLTKSIANCVNRLCDLSTKSTANKKANEKGNEKGKLDGCSGGSIFATPPKETGHNRR